MMACCIIAAYLYARLVDVLRRWCVFWGLVRRKPDEPAIPTFIDMLMRRGARPAASTIVLTLVLAGSIGMIALDHSGPQRSGEASELPRLSELVNRITP